MSIVTLTYLAALLVWNFPLIFSEYSPEQYQHQHASHTEGKVDQGDNTQEMKAKAREFKEEKPIKEQGATESKPSFTDWKQAVEFANKEEIEVEEENHGHGLVTTVVFIPIFILFLLGGDYFIQRSRRHNYEGLNSAEPQIHALATLSE